MIRVVLVATALGLGALAAPAAGAEVINLVANAEDDQGYIELGMIASSTLTDVRVGEFIDGEIVHERPFPLVAITPEVSGGTIPRAEQWRCDRSTRTFRATARTADGVLIESQFQVRTPSCRTRLSVGVPAAVKPGRAVRVTVRDTWTIGGVSAEICRRPPRAAVACRTIRFDPGQRRATSRFVARRTGRWVVTVAGPRQRVVRPVAVGVAPRPEDLELVPQVLATGDSLMQGLDDLLEDELDPRAHVSGDVHIGTGLTSDIVGDWDDIPGEQIKAFHPDATVVFLGANDSYAMTPPGGGGKPISCCEQPWIDEYARRARKAMRTYTRADPDAQVFWLTVPSARDFRRNVAAAAVNAGIYQAAGGVPRVHVLDMVTLLTPNGEYRETMPYRGREVRVRQGDGIHLSVAGQRIAGEFVIRAMERRGVF